MGMRSHRRSAMVWSSPGGRADRHGLPTFRRIRWWFRTGALLAVIGITRLARGMRARWRSVFYVTGAGLIVVGVVLPSGAALVSGILVMLIALLKGAEPNHCRAAAQMTG